MGRPPLEPGESRTERVVAHLRPADAAKLKSWAKEKGVRVGELARELLEKALHRRK